MTGLEFAEKHQKTVSNDYVAIFGLRRHENYQKGMSSGRKNFSLTRLILIRLKKNYRVNHKENKLNGLDIGVDDEAI